MLLYLGLIAQPKTKKNMTCIVGIIKKGGQIWMGGDIQTSAGSSKKMRAHSKVFCLCDNNGIEWLLGSAGKSRVSQILEFNLELPAKKAPKGKSLRGFIVKEFLPQLRKAFQDGGFMEKKAGVESIDRTQIMIGINGHLFTIDSNLHVLERREKFTTIGCGQDLSWGALFALEKDVLTPREKILIALKAAEAGTTGVSGPFNIVTNKMKKSQTK